MARCVDEACLSGFCWSWQVCAVHQFTACKPCLYGGHITCSQTLASRKRLMLEDRPAVQPVSEQQRPAVCRVWPLIAPHSLTESGVP